jgi:ribonuclease P protein component
MVQHEVVRLLREGARLNQAEFALKLSGNSFGQGRIAIAVPKRILKSAVDRNYVKRVVREHFRQDGVRLSPVDMLITLRSKVSMKKAPGDLASEAGNRLRAALTQLFTDVSRRC